VADRDVACAGCGQKLIEPVNLPHADRTPCPVCGSTSRRVDVEHNATLTPRAQLDVKGRRSGLKKPFIHQKIGSSLFRKIGRWMNRKMAVDRENDLYREVVVDPETGVEIHRCEEPLSKHFGHGSAKKKP
jgi:hypothetical protein